MKNVKFTSILQSLAIFLFIMLITFSPSIHLIPYIEFHDAQRVLQLLLLSFVLIHAATKMQTPNSLIPINKNIRIGFFLLLILAVASSYFAKAPRQAFIEISVFSALCYFALFVANLYLKNSTLLIKRLVYVLWASILLYMLSFYVGYISALSVKKVLVWPLPFYGFSNIRLFQQYQLWGLGLICLPLISFNLTSKIRAWLYIALTAWWVLLFYASSRGVILAWLAAMIVTATFYKNKAWPFLRIQLINAVSGFIVYQVLFKLIPIWVATSANTTSVVTSSLLRTSTSDRLNLWRVSLSMVDHAPFLGVGPMHFYWYNSYGTHPHNSILQLVSEFGIPATFIIIAIVTYAFTYWLKCFAPSKLGGKPKLNANLAIILFFTVMANGAYSLVSGVIVMPISQILMFAMVGLMVGTYAEKEWNNANKTVIKNKFRFRPVFALITLLALAWSTFPELKRGITSYNRVVAAPHERAFSMAPGTIIPRIWMQQKRTEPK